MKYFVSFLLCALICAVCIQTVGATDYVINGIGGDDCLSLGGDWLNPAVTAIVFFTAVSFWEPKTQ